MHDMRDVLYQRGITLVAKILQACLERKASTIYITLSGDIDIKGLSRKAMCDLAGVTTTDLYNNELADLFTIIGLKKVSLIRIQVRKIEMMFPGITEVSDLIQDLIKKAQGKISEEKFPQLEGAVSKSPKDEKEIDYNLKVMAVRVLIEKNKLEKLCKEKPDLAKRLLSAMLGYVSGEEDSKRILNSMISERSALEEPVKTIISQAKESTALRDAFLIYPNIIIDVIDKYYTPATK